MICLFDDYDDPLHENLLHKITCRCNEAPAHTGFSMQYRNRQLSYRGNHIRLTNYEFLVFWLLYRGSGYVILRDEFVYFLYEDNDNDIPLGNTVEVMVGRVRKKIQRIEAPIEIETVRGFGYRLITARESSP